MPFPLAHPAAVLPLRPFCPKRLNFPALVIGSLTPDLGYAFGHLRVDRLSHRFWAGSLGFCLPAGLVLVAAFYLIRRPLIRALPEQYQPALTPVCRQRAGSPAAIIISVLIGAWSHILLDSITHEDGWLVEHVALLRITLPWRLSVYSFLYAVCTFGGVLWLALRYLRWLELSFDRGRLAAARKNWVSSLLFAGAITVLAEAGRGPHQTVGLISETIVTGLLVTGFVAATARTSGRLLSRPDSREIE
jgi:hypothetical protein